MLSEERRRLRDELAGHALQGLVQKVRGVDDAVRDRDQIAVAAYQLADAMLDARERVLSPTLRRSVAPSSAPRASGRPGR